MSFCNGCERQKEDIVLWIAQEKQTSLLRYCRECRSPKSSVPDVYWDGKPEHNLADDPNTGQPRVFFSKGEKAAYLKSRGIMEAGDRHHGAPVQMYQNQNRKIDSRNEVQMALRKVKEMGADRRRQEYMRVVKEARSRA